jgi:hypothetical protein
VARSEWAGLVVSLVVAITVTGCGGGHEPSGIYKSADVDRPVEIAPVTPGWPPWPQGPEPKRAATASPEQLAARDPIYAEDRRRTAAIKQSDNWASDNGWKDEDKLAHLGVAVLDTSADAHLVFAANNDASRAYGAEYGVVDKAEKVGGLGDEAWRLWAQGNGSQVTYHWRRDNLVFEVHIHCYGADCPDTDAAVDAAARAWADAIDEQARSERG